MTVSGPTRVDRIGQCARSVSSPGVIVVVRLWLIAWEAVVADETSSNRCLLLWET
jgi:hypothetical protein